MEDDGFKYDGAAVYDQQEHKCIRIYGDYPDERHTHRSEPVRNPNSRSRNTSLTISMLPRTFRSGVRWTSRNTVLLVMPCEPTMHFLTRREKPWGAMNTRELPGSLDFVQCVDGKDTIIQDYAQVVGWTECRSHGHYRSA